MDVVFARGLRFSVELSNASILLTKYLPLSACYTCRINTRSKSAFPERYHCYKAASHNSLGLVNNIFVYQKSLKQEINKNGVTLAYYSDFKQSSDDEKPQTEQKLTIFQKMKQMTKDYWHVLIPVHVITSIGWIAIFYTAVRNGVDIVQLLEYMNFSEKYIDLVRNSNAGDLAITYALYKIFTPIRYTVTVGGTTMAIRYLSKLGYVKALSFKLQSVEPAGKAMTSTVK
ncbi:PREDICTED: protein FAM210A isoform X2 [Acromyrmex echinatior]|uniref:protein FAM210A isoform X2 n=1 Tax=Acromyrmex echinatior TaxID=103372 RepID=UPI000580C611|nr:PREDICTED: protein FAM210A isoform X2 [Acromyrmex echinatior]